MTVAAIADVLGGQKMLHRRVSSDAELTRLTREGLPVDTLALLADGFSIDRKALAKLAGISERTLSRRIAKGERLSAEESDRTIRIARVFAHASDTFGTQPKASSWLLTPNSVLDGQTPLSQLDTDSGVRAVETIMGRIAWGVYS